MDKWERIIREEITRMIENLHDRGVQSVKIDVSVKKIRPPQEDNVVRVNNPEGEISTYEVNSVDDLLEAFQRKKQQHKCTCCGKVSKDVRKIETGEYVCESCNDALDIYREKIKNIIKKEGKENVSLMLECIKNVTEFLEMNTEHEQNPEEEMYKDFINDSLLGYAYFETKEDVIDFLDGVINYIEDNDIDL